jgi:diguanylate cyclase (GGDEF)-like protein
VLKALWHSWFAKVPDPVRVELVDMCFQTRVPLAIAGFTLCLVSAHMAVDTLDARLFILSGAGFFVTVVRLASDVAYRRRRRRSPFGIENARRWEYLYAWSGFVFAGLIGLLGFIAFRENDPAHQLLTTALVFGYAAGIVCRISVRPAIGLPALLLVALPTALAAVTRVNGSFLFYAAILIAFLLGSFETVRFLYRQHVEQISLKHEFASLARHDALTGLANRLGLQERLAAVALARERSELLAVHSVDLDRFKEVNDRHGHPVGDALLQAVARRLKAILREGDFAARLGGDEFFVVQTNAGNRDEAMRLARRIVDTLSEPFILAGQQLSIGASVGVAIGRADQDPNDLAAAADLALYESKSAGRNRATFAKPALVRLERQAG